MITGSSLLAARIGPAFGSISGGSAFKFGLFRRKETTRRVVGSPPRHNHLLFRGLVFATNGNDRADGHGGGRAESEIPEESQGERSGILPQTQYPLHGGFEGKPALSARNRIENRSP